MVHRFKSSIKGISLPDKFTYPFNYTPHPLCLIAAKETREYLYSHPSCITEIEQGKMFGVLIVEDTKGDVGYLPAYSGIINCKNISSFFVPAVYDLLSPLSFFKEEESKISCINATISSLEKDKEYINLKERVETTEAENLIAIENEKRRLKLLKEKRDTARNSGMLSDSEKEELIKESQHQKAEYKRMLKRIEEGEKLLKSELAAFENRIAVLKDKRKRDSAALQKRLFSEFKFLNAMGEEENLWTIFSSTPAKVPPAGAGECAAPKLLQYAYLNNLRPVAMAEFWIGASPQKEIRKDGNFYPSCKGKCLPILTHMLKGLSVDEDPLAKESDSHQLEVLFEDEHIMVVNKPSGVLSVPGKGNVKSIESIIKERYPESQEIAAVHRLDMATSGLLIITKDKKSHKILQKEFLKREVKKRYIAIIEGTVEEKKGFIRLPLSADYMERPRQKVDLEHGKPAVTRYEVIEEFMLKEQLVSRVALYPLTGRTHQLRVHCAHKDGLGASILGDGLYGKKNDRLYLHAERIEFKHPVTEKIITIEKKADF